MKVFIINPVAEFGGAERVLLDFIASARVFSPDVLFHVLTFSDGPLLAAIERQGASVSVLPLPDKAKRLGDTFWLGDHHWHRGVELLGSMAGSMPSLLRFLSDLHAEIASRAPDLVHTNGVKAHLLAAAASPPRLPLIWHVHDFFSERPVARHFLKVAARRASGGIAISEAVALDLRRTVPFLRVKTILNAVDVDEFCPGPGDGSWLDRLANFPASPKEVVRIGLIATFSRWKGHEVFLKAAQLVTKAFPGWPIRFYVVGGPIYATDGSQVSLEELRARAAELFLTDRLGFIPFQLSLPPILRSLDIVVHASTRAEPFGRTVLEAMACGRAVVSAAWGGTRELVLEGKTALAHVPGEPCSLAAAIELLVRDPALRSELGSNARIDVAARFSRTRLGPQLLQAYSVFQ